MTEVRPFARSDREQLVRLVNAHVAVAVPGGYVPPATLLNDLEHPLGEYIIGPWVIDLATFVAIERDRVVAAAHVRRYGDDDRVSDSYRNAGEIVWLLCWPDHLDAGRAVRDAAVGHLNASGVGVLYGNGTLPFPGVYGVSDNWPHVQDLFTEDDFDDDGGQVEIVMAGPTAGIDPPGPQPVPGIELRRQLGTRLGGTTGLIVYTIENDLADACIGYYGRYGLRPINRTRRGWEKASRPVS